MRPIWRLRQGLGSRTGRALRALLLIAVILVATNIVVGRYAALRLDLTAEHLYTLSRGTRQTLTRIDEPITLRLYYSAKLGDASPGYGVYAQRVRELLGQYVAVARGKIRLEVYDPQPFTDAEDRAVAFGLQAVPLNDQGEAVYFGLAGTNSTDDQQIVAFFNPERERFLEYDLTRLVHFLAFPKRTVVGLLSPLPIDVDLIAAVHGRGGQPMPIIDQLRQVDDVQPLPPEFDAVPENIDVLMLVHPQNLSEKTQFAIDQYVLGGGKTLVFVDPYSELQAALQQGNPDAAAGGGGSDLERLFQAWGLRLMPNVVAGDRRRARRVGIPVPGRGSQAVDYVGWLTLQAEDLNRNDPITAELSQITMATAGILQPIEGAMTAFEPLIQTSTESEKIPVEKVKGLPDVAALLAQFKPEQRRYTLAAHISGNAATAFPDGPPADKPKEGEPPTEPPKQPAAAAEFVKQSKQPINVVVVADTDLLDDRFWAQSRDFFGRKVVVPVANNSDFLANAVEVLAGGQDLVDLRSRGTVARPFVVVERIQRSADDRFAAEQRTLEEKLKQAQAKLLTLTKGEGTASPAAPSPEQAKEIDKFRADLVATRQQLRQVQVSLREDISRLKLILELFNIALVPIIVVAAAIVIAALRPRRRRTSPG